MKIEVFSFDGNKTFGFDIKTENFEIRKSNILIEFFDIETNGTSYITEKLTLKFSPSAQFIKSVHSYLFTDKYKNKKETSIKFLSFIKEVDAIFKNESYFDIFAKYNTLNNSILDQLDEVSDESIQGIKLLKEKELNDIEISTYVKKLLKENTVFKKLV